MIVSLGTIHDVLVGNIHKFRNAKGYTIPALAERSGIQEGTLKGIIYNENWPELHRLEAIANALEIPTEALFENPEMEVVKVAPGPLEALEIVRKALTDRLAKEAIPDELPSNFLDIVRNLEKSQLEALSDTVLGHAQDNAAKAGKGNRRIPKDSP